MSQIERWLAGQSLAMLVAENEKGFIGLAATLECGQGVTQFGVAVHAFNRAARLI
jgi:hypothetical protein